MYNTVVEILFNDTIKTTNTLIIINSLFTPSITYTITACNYCNYNYQKDILISTEQNKKTGPLIFKI